MHTTLGHLLGGRIAYAQPQDGYRTGIEPVLLAASVPAQPGERVLEAGTGAGAGLLCLAARVPGVTGLGIELDPAMADLARRNLRDNRIEGIEIVTGDLMAARCPPVRHAFANPPWHDPSATPSPVARRRLAKQRGAAGPAEWAASLADLLEPGGTLTLIVPAAAQAAVIAAMQGAALGTVATLRLLPKPERPAKLVIVQARAGEGRVRGTDLVLHRPDGGFGDETESVLRGGAATALATIPAS